MEERVNKQYLGVFLHGKYVGKLCSENVLLSFSYDDNYLLKDKALKLSSSLPLQHESFDHQITSSFFSGLLPDEYVRTRLAKNLSLSDKNTFALLKEIGGECAGAVSVYPEGSSPDVNGKPSYRILDDKEAHEILSLLDKRPMLAGEEDIRISGAGAQDKLVIALIDGKIAIPKRDTPSTHIIKPVIKDLEHTVQNEFFCMRLAQAVSVPAPNVYIHWIEEEAYYLIDRYDRRQENGKIVRLHQEDFCQAMHVPPEMKYENEQGPTLQKCFALLDERIKTGAMAGRNKITLLQGVIFNYLIGNGDAHGKNFSLLYDGEAESLAPFYDLMCTVIYTNSYKAKMAMRIGSKYKFKDVTLRHFEDFGELVGFKKDFIRKQLMNIADNTIKASEDLCVELNKSSDTKSDVYEQINDVIKTHSARITEQLI